MKRAIVSLLVGSGLLASAGVALAAAPIPVGAHRHFILVNDEKVYVGPNFCELDATEQGFAGFHRKVHLTDPGLVDVKSEGCSQP